MCVCSACVFRYERVGEEEKEREDVNCVCMCVCVCYLTKRACLHMCTETLVLRHDHVSLRGRSFCSVPSLLIVGNNICKGDDHE